MSDLLAMIVLNVLVFGGAIGAGVKAMLGVRQRKFLPKKLFIELQRE